VNGVNSKTMVNQRGPIVQLPRFTGGHRTRVVILVALVAAAVPGCAHGPTTPVPPASASALRMANEARGIVQPHFEEDYLHARLVFQALPESSPDRALLRNKLLTYLLGGAAELDLAELTEGSLAGVDLADQLLTSFRDALDLYLPHELWAEKDGNDSARIPESERKLLHHAALLVQSVFGPRGNEEASALAVGVLMHLDPDRARWNAELDTLIAWVEQGRHLMGGESDERAPPSGRGLLESIVDHWATPEIVARLAAAHIERQQQLSHLVRRPAVGGISGGAPVGEENSIDANLLNQADGVPTTAVSLAAIYLRAQKPELACQTLQALEGKPGDDAALRSLLAPISHPEKASAEEFLAIARRFLPKSESLGGTSTDRVDAAAAFRVMNLGLAFHPQHIELLVLTSRTARLVGSPLLGFRLLEEAEALMQQTKPEKAAEESLSREIVELGFGLLRVHMDPENVDPMVAYAETLRRRLGEARGRFGDKADWLSDRNVDLELAKNFVDAGLVDRALPIYQTAAKDADASDEIVLQLGTILQKTGDIPGAIAFLRDAVDKHRPEGSNETIGYVESHSKMAAALGIAYDLGGRPEEAAEAYQLAARGWERLMVEHMRRRNRNATSEALVEMGKLYYLLGRREEGIEKFSESLSIAEDRDQSYIDPLSFLVQRGEIDAAIDIYRVLMSRPAQTVSEYVKVYASLWIQDLSRRIGRPPEPAADAYLKTLATRKLHLRPLRATAWYVLLARYATGQLAYEALAAMANTTGRKAELYFYQAMRLLGEGKEDAAHTLWTQVIQTKMMSFFEFEMASRYLRTGAPTTPPTAKATSLETI
jgi:tetratricopeptide (TPR) repeat protein